MYVLGHVYAATYYKEPLVINPIHHVLASERLYEISSATTFAYVPASFGPTYPDAHSEHVYDIAPDPAFLLCFSFRYRHVVSAVYIWI